MSYIIATDTSANLPEWKAAECADIIIPFSYFVEGKEYTCLDTEGFNGEAFYRMMKEKTVTTSQVTPQRYIDYLTPVLEQGKDVLFVGMSSGISGSYAACCIAAEQLRERFPGRTIRTVDTLGASLGEGLVVMRAAECRAKGMSIDDTVAHLQQYIVRICQVFTVDDLKYLRRGGRISNLSFVVGMVLHIKPLLKGNEEGKIVAFAKVRGREKSINEMAERYAQFVRNAGEQTVCIAHADCAADAERLASLLRKAAKPKEIITVCYEPVTGSHVGPGTLALFFESEEGVRQAF